jgi:hypothetical protein
MSNSEKEYLARDLRQSQCKLTYLDILLKNGKFPFDVGSKFEREKRTVCLKIYLTRDMLNR